MSRAREILARHVTGKIERGEGEAIAGLEHPAVTFLRYCEARHAHAQDAKSREFWQRLSGSVRKAIHMV
jgi:hypothetical protein